MRPILAILIVAGIIVGTIAAGYGIRALWRRQVSGWQKRARTAEARAITAIEALDGIEYALTFAPIDDNVLNALALIQNTRTEMNDPDIYNKRMRALNK